MSEAEAVRSRSPETFDLLGVVLAGGKSSRMGVDKATLPHSVGAAGRGLSYLDYAVERLRPLVQRVAVSGRVWTGTAGVVSLPDEQPDQGPAMGVLTALRFAAIERLTGVLVTPVDMPDVTSDHLRQLARAWSQTAGVVCASFDGQRAEPLLAVYPLSALPEIERVLSSPQRSLSRWIGSGNALLVDLPIGVARNVNWPSDR
jgi:molybdopterin-guanine dinucleotide biosynthesis protein A